MTVPLVVIIPTKNRRVLLERALASVFSQGYEFKRVIVIDDGSTDDTSAFLAGYVHDERMIVRRHNPNKGVNISRNEALRLARPDEWALLLDDDDELTPHSLAMVAEALRDIPPGVGVAFFNTCITTRSGSFAGGYQFKGAERWREPSYFDVMTKAGLRGDCKPVIRASLFSPGHYAFSEDVNGYESEFYARLARDGVGIRYFRDEIMRIDQAHGMERLSDTAAVRDPASFVRAHHRILADHAHFFRDYPVVLRARASNAFKVAVRAHDWRSCALFARAWVGSLFH